MKPSADRLTKISTSDKTNALTVDVEDYYQVSAFENSFRRDKWSNYESRVVNSTNRLLDLFGEHGTTGTFFTLGIIAERFPELIKRINNEGHELASHGYDHTRVTNLNERSFREDIYRTKVCLEDISGTQITGYRAPTFSITEDNDWAYSILVETGHRYSSSIYPIKRDLYGSPNASRSAFRDNRSGILEIPLTTTNFMGKTLPCAGGGFFRLYPYALTRWCYRRVNQKDNLPAIFYTHPWEYDPEQPRPPNLAFKTRIRHYLNLSKTIERLSKLLDDFNWGRMDEVFTGTDAVVQLPDAVGS